LSIHPSKLDPSSRGRITQTISAKAVFGNGAGKQPGSQTLRKFTKFVPDRPNRWRFPCDKPAELVTFAILAPRLLGKSAMDLSFQPQPQKRPDRYPEPAAV